MFGKQGKAILGIAFVLVLLVSAILLGYTQSWTGFNGTVISETATEKSIPAKSLWDWMQLLIVPAVLALIAFLFNKNERIAEREKALHDQREAALQTYLKEMTELLVGKEGAKLPLDDIAKNMARARTLTLLRTLDGERKKHVIQFLVESKLITNQKVGQSFVGHALINISGADLSNADLSGLNLTTVTFEDVNLTGANLNLANLKELWLSRSTQLDSKWQRVWTIVNMGTRKLTLRGSDLRYANLKDVDLGECDLSNADLLNFQDSMFIEGSSAR